MTILHPPILQPIDQMLDDVALAPRQAHKALTVWPLVLRDGVATDELGGPDYVPLARALEDGAVSVDEIDESGSVPHVKVANRGARHVLFLFGEEICGAKQNRIANASFLVPAQSEVVIDVTCVEQGRWERRAGERFASSEEILSHAMRRRMVGQVAESRRTGVRFAANQGAVWQDVDTRLRGARVESRTGSYEDYRRSRTGDLEEMLRAFRAVPGQVGFVAAWADEVVGLEVIGRPEVFAHHFAALVRSYAIDAVDAAILDAPARGTARFDAPEAFLAALAGAPAEGGPSLGLGDDLRIEGGGVAGCALVLGQVVHLTAFPAQG